jgi:hypothetical protein
MMSVPLPASLDKWRGQLTMVFFSGALGIYRLSGNSSAQIPQLRDLLKYSRRWSFPFVSLYLQGSKS